jgi:uncharacterized protein (DUF4415 family)
MLNTKRPDPERPDDDNPELSLEELRRSRPASEMLPGLIGEKAAGELLQPRHSRSQKDDQKGRETLHIDREVLEAYRQEGEGWQARINQVLRENMPKSSKTTS